MPSLDLGPVVGPQGEQGATGAQGIRGEQGLPGPNQVTNSTATPLTGVLTGNGSVVGVASIDEAPTADSTGFARSGGTDKAIKARMPVYGLGKNLLRNAYFVGGGTGSGVFPVNQREISSAVQSSSAFVMDGWLVAYGSGGVDYSLASGYFEVGPHNSSSYATLEQALDSSMTGKALTASILLSDGTLLYGTATVTGGDDYFYNAYPDGKNFRLYLTGGNLFIVRRTTASVQIVAVKLELGTEQTLCHNEGTAEAPVWVLNEVPDYEYELYRCMTSTASSSDDYANKTLATGQEIAYLETGATATRNYTAGQYISLSGLLYTADTAIASGATFYTSGGNKNLTGCVGGGLNSNSIYRAAIPLYNASSLFTLERGFGIAKFYGGNNGTTAVLTRTEQGSSKSRTISVGASSWENIPVVAGDTITYYGGPNSNGEIYYIGHHIGQ